MKNLKTSIVVIVAIFILTVLTFATENEEYTLMENIDYTETIEDIKNPERGFYSTAFLNMLPTGTKPTNSRANLVHLRVNIGEFSKAINGTGDLELTEDALNALDATLQNIKNNGGSVIIRFAYDHFNGLKNVEPSLEMILKHISQLKPIFYKNEDVIDYVELGFFGPCGEMNSSTICTTENVSKAIDAMLDAVPTNIKIGVRTPNYYAKWLGVDRATLNENITQKGTDEYRIGLFNDGYLGSNNDLGTFANREIEIAWLENQATHTFYGGEVVANYNPVTKPAINTIEYISQEAFRTHTTYLNSEWNDKVIKAWKEEIYNGDNELYVGQTGYFYVSNHLGYRFVLKKSEVTDNIEANDTLKIKLQIENVGFANLINNKVVTIVLQNNEKTYEIPTNIDATNWASKEISSVNIDVPLPKDIELGDYNIYLRISQHGNMNEDNNYKCIKLANNNIWNEDFAANYIGKVTISEVSKEEQKPDNNEGEDQNPNNNNGEAQNPNIDNEETQNPNDNNVTENNNSNEDKDNTNNQNNTNSQEIKDNTTAQGKLPNTGENKHKIVPILILSIMIIISWKNYKK